MADQVIVRQLLTKWGFEVNKGNIESVSNNIDKFKRKTEEVGKKFDELGKKIDHAFNYSQIGTKLSNIGGALTRWITVPILGSIGAIVAISKDMDEFVNKSDVLFKENAESVRQWAETTGLSFSISHEQMMRYAEKGNAVAISLKLAGKEAIGFAENLAKSAVIQSRLKGMEPSSIMRMYQRALTTGSVRMLKGMFGTMPLLDASGLEIYNNAINKYGKNITLAQKQTAIYNAILASNSEALIYNEKWQKTLSGSIQKAKISLELISDSLVVLLTPALIKIAESISKLSNWWENLTEKQKESYLHWVLIAASIGPVIFMIGKLYTTVAYVISFTKAIQGLMLAMKATAAAGAVTNIVIAWLPMLITGLIILIGILVYEIIKHWEFVKKNWGKILATIGAGLFIIATMFAWIGPLVGYIIYRAIKSNWDKVSAFYGMVFSKINSAQKTYLRWVNNALHLLFTGGLILLVMYWGRFGEIFRSIWSTIKAKWKMFKSNIVSWGEEMKVWFMTLIYNMLPKSVADYLNIKMPENVKISKPEEEGKGIVENLMDKFGLGNISIPEGGLGKKEMGGGGIVEGGVENPLDYILAKTPAIDKILQGLSSRADISPNISQYVGSPLLGGKQLGGNSNTFNSTVGATNNFYGNLTGTPENIAAAIRDTLTQFQSGLIRDITAEVK
jgi:hypothetical protein